MSHCEGAPDPLCDCYAAGYIDGEASGWNSGYLQAGAQLVAWASATAKAEPSVRLTETERRGVRKAYEAMQAIVASRQAVPF